MMNDTIFNDIICDSILDIIVFCYCYSIFTHTHTHTHLQLVNAVRNHNRKNVKPTRHLTGNRQIRMMIDRRASTKTVNNAGSDGSSRKQKKNVHMRPNGRS